MGETCVRSFVLGWYIRGFIVYIYIYISDIWLLDNWHLKQPLLFIVYILDSVHRYVVYLYPQWNAVKWSACLYIEDNISSDKNQSNKFVEAIRVWWLFLGSFLWAPNVPPKASAPKTWSSVASVRYGTPSSSSNKEKVKTCSFNIFLQGQKRKIQIFRGIPTNF